MASVLLEFNSCVTSIRRLYSRSELVSGVLGAKAGDLQEATPLAELVIAGDLEELVGWLRGHCCRTAGWSVLFYAVPAVDRQLEVHVRCSTGYTLA